jgi:uncharacterized protein
VHALLTWSALTGSGRHRDAAEAALRHVRTLAERVPRFAGWSLAAAEAALAGPVEVAVISDPDDAAGDELVRTARQSSSPGLVLMAGPPDQVATLDARLDDPLVLPLLADRPLVDGQAAAYVCRGMVCDRPVTTAEELARQLRS